MKSSDRGRKHILIISTFPPRKCGVGTYAQEQLLYLKRHGHIVYSASFYKDCFANYKVQFETFSLIIKSMIRCLKFLKFDEIHLHYSFEFIYPAFKTEGIWLRFMRLMQSLLLAWIGILGRKGSNIIFHELPLYPTEKKLTRLIRGWAFARFNTMSFHTETERSGALKFYKLLKPEHCHVVNHERFMSPKFHGTKAQARQTLGISENQVVALCIGFIQEHKGFDIALEAAENSSNNLLKLYIVGSVRTPTESFLAYRDALKENIMATKNVTLIEEYVTDQMFDLWITASDAVVLPYRTIASSGVGARATLLNTPLFINAATNLKSQFDTTPLVHAFETTSELTRHFDHLTHKPLPESDQGNHLLATDLSKPMLFVMPWFGQQVKGGAEGFIYNLCLQLHNRGHKVEVWSSGSDSIENRNDHFLDQNHDQSTPFPVRRFPTNINTELFFNLTHRIINRGKGCAVTRKIWKKAALTGIGMEEALHNEVDRFSTIHLCHYFSGSSHRLAGLAPQKTILHPFIHNEPVFFSKVMTELFVNSRGVICNTEAEQQLALQSSTGLLPSLYKPIGNGVNISKSLVLHPNESFSLSRRKQICFIGRLIPEKNLPLLFKWLDTYNRNHLDDPLQLICIGEGPLKSEHHDTPNITFTGWLKEEEKYKVLQESLALIQLSLYESFSLVMMEAWLLGTPAIVHNDCLATKTHLTKSGGGFVVGNFKEFEEAIKKLTENPKISDELAVKGNMYVHQNFTWDQVCKNFENARQSILA